MKTLLLTLIVLAWPLAKLPGQIDLNPGDTYSFQFNSLPSQSEITCTFGPCLQWGGIGLTYTNSTQGTALLQMYDTSLNDPSPLSTTINVRDGSGVGGWVSSISPWQDHRGAFRFTMLSGNATLTSFSLFANDNGGHTVIRYSLTVYPVPEPTFFALLLFAGLALCLLRRTRPKRVNQQYEDGAA